MGAKLSRSQSVHQTRKQLQSMERKKEKQEFPETKYYREDLSKLNSFSLLRTRHFALVDGLNVTLLDPAIQMHEEFPMQIESLKRSGAFIVMHGSENYDKFSRRLEDVNEDIVVLTSYIIRYLIQF